VKSEARQSAVIGGACIIGISALVAFGISLACAFYSQPELLIKKDVPRSSWVVAKTGKPAKSLASFHEVSFGRQHIIYYQKPNCNRVVAEYCRAGWPSYMLEGGYLNPESSGGLVYIHMIYMPNISDSITSALNIHSRNQFVPTRLVWSGLLINIIVLSIILIVIICFVMWVVVKLRSWTQTNLRR